MRVCTPVFISIGAFAWLLAGIATTAQAAPISCCDFSSDATPASELSATFDFSVVGSILTLEVTNDTAGAGDFNINEIYFNATNNVSSLTLDAATHSVLGDVFVHWDPVMTDVMEDGFGVFDYAIMDGVGETDPWLITPGDSIVFELTIGGVGPFSMSDFNVANLSGYTLGGKFVNGPGDDSAWGANIPEPSTAVLVGFGMLILGVSRRRSLV